jgi:hypothetical protein
MIYDLVKVSQVTVCSGVPIGGGSYFSEGGGGIADGGGGISDGGGDLCDGGGGIADGGGSISDGSSYLWIHIIINTNFIIMSRWNYGRRILS